MSPTTRQPWGRETWSLADALQFGQNGLDELREGLHGQRRRCTSIRPPSWQWKHSPPGGTRPRAEITSLACASSCLIPDAPVTVSAVNRSGRMLVAASLRTSVLSVSTSTLTTSAVHSDGDITTRQSLHEGTPIAWLQARGALRGARRQLREMSSASRQHQATNQVLRHESQDLSLSPALSVLRSAADAAPKSEMAESFTAANNALCTFSSFIRRMVFHSPFLHV